MIKPIKNYESYFFAKTGKLYGLTATAIDVIDVIDQDGDLVEVVDFFTKGGCLYFETREVSLEEETEITGKIEVYQQKISAEKFDEDGNTIYGKITEIDKLPDRPNLNRSHYDSKEFIIKDATFEEKKCTDVKNLVVNSGIERFYMVNGFYHFPEAGIFFNVSDGRYNDEHIVRENGLYFWSVRNKGIEYLVGEGSLWK